ncbi:DUF4173 domain-containing protein [Alisedimentitalea sp. MJ-SS2]|uniref:DUF4153 domain-containing protein n=1 Tax=Aliisedimentitalea sp. MJ-SS2 TaxID=3049795 RepID=UPI00290DE471|nr:DUF4173 domain-containing protein [Alisedimentitalea sp. MJ-SS2]MDU8928031.1 DUF4173 domain-containing protein [Alisedimentitalea sp. MJ-SS2]
MKTFLLRGVPNSLAMDAWWLTSSMPPRPRPQDPGLESPLWPMRAGALVGLIALADFLLWQVAAPGISLAVFGMMVLLVAWVLAGRRGTSGLVVAFVLFIPVIERVQALSFFFWVTGMIAGATCVALARWPTLAAGLRFVLHAPGLVVLNLIELTKSTDGIEMRGNLRSAYLGWFLPLGLGLLFLLLLINANPVLEGWLNTTFRGPSNLNPDRMIFWAGVGFLAWPFLSLRFMVQRLLLGFAAGKTRTLPAFFNAQSIRRSLILFNAVFAIQTLPDIAIFSGGASLPSGMSYAEYAHRGAYPLLATALLAGAFALAVRPFVRGNITLRAALLFWMAQTLLLVISSLIRLESYVSVYGLTQFRLAAMVWMGTVAIGITLVIAQVLRDQTAAWLLKRCAALGVMVLYLCSLNSFAATITQYNLTHDVVRDAHYLCSLDSAALPVIRQNEITTGTTICYGSSIQPFHLSSDWREWGFRDWRTARSLSAFKAGSEAPWPTY